MANFWAKLNPFSSHWNSTNPTNRTLSGDLGKIGDAFDKAAFEVEYGTRGVRKGFMESLKPSNVLAKSIRSAPVLTLGLGAAAGAGLYSHFAQPQITRLPEADAEAIAAAQREAQLKFLENNNAMVDPRDAPMKEAMALQAHLGGPPTMVDAGTIAGTQRLAAPGQALGT